MTAPARSRGGVPGSLPPALVTAIENVRLGGDQVFADRSGKEREEIALHYLTLVGLADDRDKRPAALSGGMRQRGHRRAFALSPKVLLR